MVYYFFIEEDYNRLFYLLNSTKNLELYIFAFIFLFFFYNSLALKLVAYLKINRADLGEQVLKQMKSIDEDNCLTALSECWLSVSKQI